MLALLQTFMVGEGAEFRDDKDIMEQSFGPDLNV